eukprot:1446276-Karenia_brevis.AAC.1
MGKGYTPWSPDDGKGGYQGVCWKCGVKGHKSYESNGTMIQGVDTPGSVDKLQASVDGGIPKDACSMEKSGGKSWVVGAVTRSVPKYVPKHVRSRVNMFENLAEEDDDDDDDDDAGK